MKILLVNDDGYLAEGITTLDKVLSAAGHSVWVCAPDSQRSASSHAATIGPEITITEVSPRHFKCSGFPADCVLYALKGAIGIGRPDVVISGINKGFNISSDLLYSGTAGAAAEGAAHDIPSFALSCQSDDDNVFPYEEAALFMSSHLSDFVACYRPGCYININVPKGAEGKWRTATIGAVEYYDNLVHSEKDDVYSLKSSRASEPVKGILEKGSDFDLTRKQKTVAVSAIRTLPALDNEVQKRLSSLQ